MYTSKRPNSSTASFPCLAKVSMTALFYTLLIYSGKEREICPYIFWRVAWVAAPCLAVRAVLCIALPTRTRPMRHGMQS